MTRRILALVASAALMGACHDPTNVPDLNNVSAETISGGLTTATGQLLVTGLTNQYRNSAIGNYVTFGESMARNALRIDKAEPRYVSEIIGSVQPDNGAFTGQGVFAAFFVTIRSANTLINAARSATDASGFTQAQRDGLIGIGQTMKAIAVWNVIEYRDSLGTAIDLDHDINAPPADWVCKKNVLAYISALLDSANTALSTAGSAFAVTLPTGYRAVAGTPAGFARFNRGLKAKVELYRGLATGGPNNVSGNSAANFAAALTAINQSFMSSATLTPAGMATGVYQTYSTATGETTNARVDAALHLNDAVSDSIQSGDLRASKILTASAASSLTVGAATVSTTHDFFQSIGSAMLTAPLPILKNEELLLLRAQIAIEQNDLVNATTFLNFVRQTSGGLAPYALFTSQAAARNALLYEKRYSLLMEGPHRLLDLRAYGRMNSANFLPGSKSSPIPGDVFTSVLPVPVNELNARGLAANASPPMTCQ